MKPSPPPAEASSWTLEIVLGLLGAFCVMTALQMPLTSLGAVLGVLLIGLLLWSVVLWRVLKRRNPPVPATGGAPPMPADAPALYRMWPGRVYEVQQDFTDDARQTFARGERLVFRQRHFLPYHDGHTLMFDGRVVQLQGDAQRELIEDWDAYMAPMRLPFEPPTWPTIDATLRQRVDELLCADSWPQPPPATTAHEKAAREAERKLLEATWNLPTDPLLDTMDDGIRLLRETIAREVPWLSPRGRMALINSFVSNRR